MSFKCVHTSDVQQRQRKFISLPAVGMTGVVDESCVDLCIVPPVVPRAVHDGEGYCSVCARAWKGANLWSRCSLPGCVILKLCEEEIGTDSVNRFTIAAGSAVLRF